MRSAGGEEGGLFLNEDVINYQPRPDKHSPDRPRLSFCTKLKSSCALMRQSFSNIGTFSFERSFALYNTLFCMFCISPNGYFLMSALNSIMEMQMEHKSLIKD